MGSKVTKQYIGKLSDFIGGAGGKEKAAKRLNVSEPDLDKALKTDKQGHVYRDLKTLKYELGGVSTESTKA